MTRENLMVGSHKSQNANWDKRYDHTFNKLEEVREQQECKLCGEEGGVICSKAEWESVWYSICDSCAFKIMK